jgi:hypothetical protein
MNFLWPHTYLGMWEGTANLEIPMWGVGTRFAGTVQDGLGWGDSPAFIIETMLTESLQTWPVIQTET